MFKKLAEWLGGIISGIWDALAGFLTGVVQFLWDLLVDLIEWALGGLWWFLKICWEDILSPLAGQIRALLTDPFADLWQNTGVAAWFDQGGFIGTFINVDLIFDSLALSFTWLGLLVLGKFVLRLVPGVG